MQEFKKLSTLSLFTSLLSSSLLFSSLLFSSLLSLSLSLFGRSQTRLKPPAVGTSGRLCALPTGCARLHAHKAARAHPSRPSGAARRPRVERNDSQSCAPANGRRAPPAAQSGGRMRAAPTQNAPGRRPVATCGCWRPLCVGTQLARRPHVCEPLDRSHWLVF